MSLSLCLSLSLSLRICFSLRVQVRMLSDKKVSEAVKGILLDVLQEVCGPLITKVHIEK